MTEVQPEAVGPVDLVAALENQRIVFERTEALAATNRRQRWMIAALAAVVAVLVAVVAVGAWVVVDTRQTAADLAANTARDGAARNAQTLENCRTRNAASKGNRERWTTFYDGLAHLFPTANGQEFVANLRAEAPIPLAAEEDLDCDASGAIDAGDYPAP